MYFKETRKLCRSRDRLLTPQQPAWHGAVPTHADGHTPGISAGKRVPAASRGDPHNRHCSAAVAKGRNEGWSFCSQRKHDYKHCSRFNSSFPPEVRSSPRCLSYSVQHRLPEIPLGIWSYGPTRTSRNSSNRCNDFKVY